MTLTLLQQINNERRLYDRHKQPQSGSEPIPKPAHWAELHDCFSSLDEVEPRLILDGAEEKGKGFDDEIKTGD